MEIICYPLYSHINSLFFSVFTYFLRNREREFHEKKFYYGKKSIFRTDEIVQSSVRKGTLLYLLLLVLTLV